MNAIDSFHRTALMVVSGLGVALVTGPAQAVTFQETQDAGASLADAVSIFSEQVSTLSGIVGTLSGDVDLFKLFLSGGQQFSATTLNAETLLGIPIDDTLGNPSPLLGDPQLFLFDALGQGVYANDDSFGNTQATLPSFSFSPTVSGIYYLAITSADLDPVSLGGEIFPDEPFDAVQAPTGPGGGSPLTGFTGVSTTSGRYAIALTGAQTIAQSAAVPEPATLLGLLALGALGAVKKSHRQSHPSFERTES